MAGLLLGNRSLTRVLGDAQSFSRRLVSSERDQILATASPATLAHITAVETADGQELPIPWLQARVSYANWRIPLGGASTLLSAARTLNGALVPVVGTAATGLNLVTGDYNGQRLQLDGATKAVQIPITQQDPQSGTQNNRHAVAGLSDVLPFVSQGYLFAHGNDVTTSTVGRDAFRVTTASTTIVVSCSSPWTILSPSNPPELPAGLSGNFRNNADSYLTMIGGATQTVNKVSNAPDSTALTWKFGVNTSNAFYWAAPLNLISVGPHIDPVEFNNKYNEVQALVESFSL